MAVGGLKTIFDWTAVILLFLTFAAGVGVLITGNIINERQARQLRQFDKNLTEAKTALARQEERTATMEAEAMSLQKELVAQGSRAALLYGKNRDVFVDKLKPFKGQEVEIRHCRASFNQFFIDNDTMSLTMLLETILSRNAQWAVNPPVEDNCGGTGLSLSLSPKASEASRKAADALLAALIEVPLTVIGTAVAAAESPRPLQPKMYTASGQEIPLPALDANTIVLTVLAHP